MSVLPTKTIAIRKKSENPAAYGKEKPDGASKRLMLTVENSNKVEDIPKSFFFLFSIPKECSNKLKLIGSQYNVSLSIIVLTAFNTLMYRHTNQTNLVVGYQGDEYNTDDGIGIEHFGKLLPIRISLAENLLFVGLLQQVQKVVDVAVIQKRGVKLFSEASSPADNQSFHFSPAIIFSFKNIVTGSENKIPQNIEVKYDHTDDIDLNLFVTDTTSGLECKLEYKKQLYEAEEIIRMADHFGILLNEITSNPNQRIAQIPILSEKERNTLLFEWNNTYTLFPEDKCIHELFEEQVLLNPNAIAAELHSAVRTFSSLQQRELTYAELNERANQVANYLQSIGVGPDVIVGVCMKRSLEMVVALLGILKAGGAYLPLDPGHPKDRLDFIFKDSGISIILTQHKLINKLPVFETKVVCLDTEWPVISTYSDENPHSLVTPQNLSYIIYTSGSTGVPKGTLIIHRGVVNYLSWCIKAYKVAEGNGCPVNSSIGFDATITSFFSPLLAGKKVLLLPEDGEIEALADILKSKNKFSLLKITPAHLEILDNLLPDKNMEGHTNALVIGGEALVGRSLNFWRKHAPSTKLINEYGPTETVVGCCVYEVTAEKSLTGDIPIGRPIANTQIYILDNFMQPVPIGVVGDIYIGGAGLARGYLNRPELTTERFVLNPFNRDPNARLYKTGDIGRYLNDGNIVYIGRVDNQVKVRGYRIELGEIEHALQQMEWVSQAVVLSREDNEGGKRLAGYYVPDAATVKSMERQLQEQRLASWNEVNETAGLQTKTDKYIVPELKITGWKDSFTGQLIPDIQMKDWLDDIIAVILSEQPEQVLEIGCGNGLVYYRLAGKIKKYIGSDLSKSSIRQIHERISKNLSNYCKTELFTAPPHKVTLLQGQQVDTILLNSTVQYFPGESYMNAVMENCMAIINGKGRIIITDVRDNRLLELFKGRLRLQKSPDSVSVKEFKWGLEQDLMKEEALCFSPAYFYGLRETYPQITHVEIQWKRANYINELSLYRYTVIIYVGIEKNLMTPQWQSWDSIGDKNHLFSANGHQRSVVALSNIPNPRLWKERLLQCALQDESIQTVGELMQALEKEDAETVQIRKLLQVAESTGYSQKLLVHEDPFKMNLLFEINPQKAFIQLPSSGKIQCEDESKTNIPLFSDISFLLRKDIRKMLLSKLPEYMVPSELITLRQMPLTINGKVDHTALQLPDQQRQDGQKAFVKAQSKLEIALTKLFEKLLGITTISIQDDVFELGMNSMQAYRLFAQIRKITGIQLPLSVLLEAPTIEQLAICLERKEAKLPWSSIVPIQPKGSKPPLFLVHAGAGTVLFYRDLSRRLGEDQPVYGIQPQGLDGKKHFHESIEEMAQHYVKEIRTVDPEGPYLVGGYCFGAVVAFEMAQQLINQGSKVALLANFNGVAPMYDDRSINNNNEKPEQLKTNVHQRLSVKQNVPLQISTINKLLYTLIVMKKRIKIKLWRKFSYRYIFFLIFLYKCYRALGLKSPEPLRKYYLYARNAEMVNVYKPKPYLGMLTVFRSPGIYHDPHLGWKEFIAGEINVCDVPGYHKDRREIMNEPFVEYTAKQLEIYIERYGAKASPETS